LKIVEEEHMERTTLEATRDSLDEENIQFETIHDAKVLLGAGEGGPDSERVDSRYCINVGTRAYDPATDSFSRDIHIQLWITPTQIAEIVKQYFAEMLRHTPRVYRQLLERLLRKRWAVMTSLIYQHDYPGCKRVPPYHKIHDV